VVLLAAVGSAPAAAAPRVHQLVVFRDGSARSSQPVLAAATAKVDKRRCAVAGGTALAALIRSRIGPLSLKDYGSCSKRATDAGGLFVAGIGTDRNKGSDGWVYKAGNVLGTAGAGDPSGPLGHGRIRAGTRVTWFWCHVTTRDKGCPHTLAVSAKVSGSAVRVRVRRYDDRGKGLAAAGALVHAGSATATAGSDGVAHITLTSGRHSVWATQPGRIRSFSTGVTVG
jgi:hypothetical protein